MRYRLEQTKEKNRFYSKLLCVLNSSFNGLHDKAGKQIETTWCFHRSTLAHFVGNYSICGCKKLEILTSSSTRRFETNSIGIGMEKKGDNIWRYKSGTRVIVTTTKKPFKVNRVHPADYEEAKINIPEGVGKHLDNYDIDWHRKIKRISQPTFKGVFFNGKRKANGYELMRKMLECGERAGIRDQMFMAFGNLLGYVLFNDFLPNDDDIDMNIMPVPQAKRHQYLMECRAAGITGKRLRGPVHINKEYCWFSIGEKSIRHQHGVKSCNWFWFPHGGYWWHSKGEKWINRQSLHAGHKTAKGIPNSVFDGTLTDIEFHGIPIKAPRNIGRCLDAWYGNWIEPRGGSSAIDTVLVMPKEHDKHTWYIEKKKK